MNQEYDTPYNGTRHSSPATRNDVEKLIDYLKSHEIQTYTRDRPFNDETLQARDFFTCGAEYFDSGKAFKSFCRNFRNTTFADKKKKRKPGRSCAVSDPESEEELEPHLILSDDEDEDDDNNNNNNNNNNNSDEDIANSIFAEEPSLYGIEEEGLYDEEATINALRDLIRNLAQVEGL